jgi:hypothetical protein
MEGVRLEDVRRALASRDPELARLVKGLAQIDVLPNPDEVVEEGALTYYKFVNELSGWNFGYKSDEEKRQYRTTSFEELGDKERLPERLWLHEIILHLWQSEGAYERAQLLEIIATCPLNWGPWKGLKTIFKHAEAHGDVELLAAIAARIDSARSQSGGGREVSGGTKTYMVRRAWRYLRRVGERFPSRYADVAVEFMRFYPDNTNWRNTWVMNHIMFHGTRRYDQLRFGFWRLPEDVLKDRAYLESWQRTPRPLFTLLERARSEHARHFAVEALKKDFRTTLREVEPGWVARLIQVRSKTVHEFVVWILDNVPKFEQSSFRDMGLHEGVLRLLYSPSSAAQLYATKYARTHARDMPVDELLILVNSDSSEVRKLADSLIRERDPRKDVGLDAWGNLLGTQHAHKLAVEMLNKHFGSSEMTADWFKARLFNDSSSVRKFAMEQVLKVHARKTLGVGFFTGLFNDERLERHVANWALFEISEHFELEAIDAEFWRRSLLHPHSSPTVRGWITSEKLKAKSFGVEFWKSLAYQPDFEEDAWMQALRTDGPVWARGIAFNEEVANFSRGLLGDVRQFSPDEVGFEWLMKLVKRLESQYHNFAEHYMLKALLPADFAPQDEAAASAASAPTGAATIDFNEATFLFTGKLATMTRGEAQKKVTGANGKSSKSVTKTLDYLVVGDEGSPLFGGGKKGSKLVKAEKLQEAGSEIKIISETAFLQMLTGGIREVSEDSIEQGCEALWEMATQPGKADDPLRRFAQTYMLNHHELICPALNERQVDPGAEVPREFFTWERVSPLFADERRALRTFALDLARWELSRWAPPLHEVVELCELPHKRVALFFEEALTAPESKETQYYRLGREQLTVEGVYRFCESLNKKTREIGMALIARYSDLAIPSELFRLTESPDRHLRAFAVRTIWKLYRHQGITEGWKPAELEVRYPTVKTKKGLQSYETGAGAAPRPEAWPATQESLHDFLRRILYSIPPAKPSRAEASGDAPTTEGEQGTPGKKAPESKPVSARKAKRSLIQVMRDLGLEDRAFAGIIAPLLAEFMDSRGKSERSACLVALTQLRAAWPDVHALPEGVSVIKG